MGLNIGAALTDRGHVRFCAVLWMLSLLMGKHIHYIKTFKMIIYGAVNVSGAWDSEHQRERPCNKKRRRFPPVCTLPLCFFKASLLLNLFPQLSALHMNLASPLHASLCCSKLWTRNMSGILRRNLLTRE